jgi:hypothetical protein
MVMRGDFPEATFRNHSGIDTVPGRSVTDPGRKRSFANKCHREIRQEKLRLADPADEPGNKMDIYNDIYNDITDREV